jgi:hypothetical protein
MEINKRGQRALVAAHGLLNKAALDTLEDELLHRRIEANLHDQAGEVDTAVFLAQRTPEAEPYLRNVLNVGSAVRTQRLSRG